jgi:hypothetical protein
MTRIKKIIIISLTILAVYSGHSQNPSRLIIGSGLDYVYYFYNNESFDPDIKNSFNYGFSLYAGPQVHERVKLTLGLDYLTKNVF